MISKQNSAHYKWGDNCDSWVFLNSDNLSIKLEVMPSNTSEELHYHNRSQQFFFIQKGEAVFQLNSKTIHVSAGEGINVKPKELHLIKNEQEEPLEFLVISSPNNSNDRVLRSQSPKN